MIHSAPGAAAMIAAMRAQPSGRKLARTLAASRCIDFADTPNDKEWRRRNALAIKEGAVKGAKKLESWRRFALELAGPEREKSQRLLFARQESRLVVNMAGGVFENGGLCLDRLSGLPVIPGSAVKGCARRLALAALQEWTSGQLVPGDAENILSPVIEGFNSPADLLFSIALILGWSDLEWKGREDFESDEQWQKKRSDFAWACGPQWQQIRLSVANQLLAHLRITPRPEHVAKPWLSLPHFAGSVAFLPAYPWERDPGIDLDVVTSHHQNYYKGEPGFEEAPDTEDPVPVVFPAISPGQTWVFLLQPGLHATEDHLAHARRWLAHGLETFGIGAKTNAGYGWFDASSALGETVIAHILENKKLEVEHQARLAEEARRKAEEEERRRINQIEERATADMTEEQRADWKLARLSTDQFESKLKNFFKDPKKGGPAESEKPAIVRALKGARLDAWTSLKAKAAKGGDYAKSEQGIRALNKELYRDKMP